MEQTIAGFLNKNEVEGKINHEVYADYVNWCSQRGEEPLKFRTFAIKLCRGFGYTTKQKCTRAGMVQVIEKAKIRDGLDGFIGERGPEMFEDMPVKDAYSLYKAFCEDEGYRTLGKIEFSRRMCATMGLRTKSKYRDKEYVRVFSAEYF